MKFLKDSWSFLFNIDLCDLSLIISHKDIANYADENIP